MLYVGALTRGIRRRPLAAQEATAGVEPVDVVLASRQKRERSGRPLVKGNGELAKAASVVEGAMRERHPPESNRPKRASVNNVAHREVPEQRELQRAPWLPCPLDDARRACRKARGCDGLR